MLNREYQDILKIAPVKTHYTHFPFLLTSEKVLEGPQRVGMAPPEEPGAVLWGYAHVPRASTVGGKTRHNSLHNT